MPYPDYLLPLPEDSRDATPFGWPSEYRVFDIPNPIAPIPDYAVFRRASTPDRPAVLVLHTWSGDGMQTENSLMNEALAADWNYIHPNVRGPNRTPDACCSALVQSDIEASIDFILKYTDVGLDDIHVVGASGGGYTALCYFMATERPIASVSSWVGISDLAAWHGQVDTLGYPQYADDIESCTDSAGSLDIDEAHRRSPLHFDASTILGDTPLQLYAGIDDGYVGQGSVPTSHSLDMFNRLAADQGLAPIATDVYDAVLAADRSFFIAPTKLGTRDLYWLRDEPFGTIYIFDGGHEMLAPVAFERLSLE